MDSAPRWPLERVKALASAGAVWVRRTRARVFFAGNAEAVRAVTRAIAALTDDDFAATATLADKTAADVYGVLIDGAGWYLKLWIDEEGPDGAEVDVISFHPLEHPLRTRKGMVSP